MPAPAFLQPSGVVSRYDVVLRVPWTAPAAARDYPSIRHATIIGNFPESQKASEKQGNMLHPARHSNIHTHTHTSLPISLERRVTAVFEHAVTMTYCLQPDHKEMGGRLQSNFAPRTFVSGWRRLCFCCHHGNWALCTKPCCATTICSTPGYILVRCHAVRRCALLAATLRAEPLARLAFRLLLMPRALAPFLLAGVLVLLAGAPGGAVEATA